MRGKRDKNSPWRNGETARNFGECRYDSIWSVEGQSGLWKSKSSGVSEFLEPKGPSRPKKMHQDNLWHLKLCLCTNVVSKTIGNLHDFHHTGLCLGRGNRCSILSLLEKTLPYAASPNSKGWDEGFFPRLFSGRHQIVAVSSLKHRWRYTFGDRISLGPQHSPLSLPLSWDLQTGFFGKDPSPQWASKTEIWVFPKIVGFPPKWMVKIMEHPIKMDDFGGSMFGSTPIWMDFCRMFFDLCQKPCSMLRLIHHHQLKNRRSRSPVVQVPLISWYHELHVAFVAGTSVLITHRCNLGFDSFWFSWNHSIILFIF